MKHSLLIAALVSVVSAASAGDFVVLRRTSTVNMTYNLATTDTNAGLAPFRARNSEIQLEIIELTPGAEKHQIVEIYNNYQLIDPEGPRRAFIVNDVTPGLPYTRIPTTPAGSSVWVSSEAQLETVTGDFDDLEDGVDDYFSTIGDVTEEQGRTAPVRVTPAKTLNIPRTITIEADGAEQLVDDVEAVTGFGVRRVTGRAVLDARLTRTANTAPTDASLAAVLAAVKATLGSYTEVVIED
jgi:hypothetical protein